MFKHETIQCDSILPAKITLNDSSVDRCRGEPHWHEELQLIYVDEGSLNMTVGNRKSALNAGDVQMINPCEVHSLKKSSAKFLSVHFSRVFVQSFFETAESYGYVLEDGSQERREMVFLMQKLLAVERNNFDEYSSLVKYSLLLKMLRLLLTRCRTEKTVSIYGTERSLDDDVIAVKQYIEANYHRKIMTADYENLLHFDATYVMTISPTIFPSARRQKRTAFVITIILQKPATSTTAPARRKSSGKSGSVTLHPMRLWSNRHNLLPVKRHKNYQTRQKPCVCLYK